MSKSIVFNGLDENGESTSIQLQVAELENGLNALVLASFDSSGNVQTGSDGGNAIPTVLKDAGTASGIINAGEKQQPVVSNSTPPAGQSHTFSATIKRAVFQYFDADNSNAITEDDAVLYVVFGALSNPDAKARLDTAGMRRVIPINSGIHEFNFPDAGGAMRMDFAVSATSLATSEVAWEVTL